MINGTFDRVPLGPKWLAFFERHQQGLKTRSYPGSGQRSPARRRNAGGTRQNKGQDE